MEDDEVTADYNTVVRGRRRQSRREEERGREERDQKRSKKIKSDQGKRYTSEEKVTCKSTSMAQVTNRCFAKKAEGHPVWLRRCQMVWGVELQAACCGEMGARVAARIGRDRNVGNPAVARSEARWIALAMAARSVLLFVV